MSLVLQLLPLPHLASVESLPIVAVDRLRTGGPGERERVRVVRRGRTRMRERGRGEGVKKRCK